MSLPGPPVMGPRSDLLERPMALHRILDLFGTGPIATAVDYHALLELSSQSDSREKARQKAHWTTNRQPGRSNRSPTANREGSAPLSSDDTASQVPQSQMVTGL